MDSSDPSLPQTSPSVFVSDQSPSLPPPPSSSPEVSPADHKLDNGVNGPASGSDNEGFVSGEEEEFESEPTRPILVYPDGRSPKGQEEEEAAAADDPSLNSPAAERPIAKVTFDDDGESDDDDDDDDLEQGGGGVEKEEVREAVKESGAGDIDSHDVVVEASAVDKGFESGGVEAVGGAENGVEVQQEKEKEKDEEVVSEERNEPLLDTQQGGGAADNSDSLVDTVQVNLLRSSVAVVGDKVEVEEPEVKEQEKETAEDVGDKVAGGDDAGHGQESDIAAIKKGESSELASHSLEAVQDDINIEGRADEGETESHIEASGEGDEEKHHHADREIDASV